MMTQQKETTITRSASDKLLVVREFDGTPEQVWNAWTDSKLLDKWWAPKPWKANTQSMDFRAGGTWLYYMQGPDGTRHYCRVDYQSVLPKRSFSSVDAFCDEKGNVNTDLPAMRWNCDFSKTDDGTEVIIEITFASEADLEKIVEMGFKEGFTMAHSNLDELLAQ